MKTVTPLVASTVPDETTIVTERNTVPVDSPSSTTHRETRYSIEATNQTTATERMRYNKKTIYTIGEKCVIQIEATESCWRIAIRLPTWYCESCSTHVYYPCSPNVYYPCTLDTINASGVCTTVPSARMI